MGQAPSVPVIAIVVMASLIAAVTDFWKFKVYNAVTLPLLVAGLCYHAVIGGPSDAGRAAGLLNSLLGVLCGSGVLLVFYLMGGMGAGDVKLMAAVGAWLGLPFTFYVFLASSLAAGLYAVVLILFCGRVRETWINLKIIWYWLAAFGRYLGADDCLEAEVNRSDRRRRVIPFAATVAVGVIAVFAWSWLERSR